MGLSSSPFSFGVCFTDDHAEPSSFFTPLPPILSSPYSLSSSLSFSSQHDLVHGSGELRETSANRLGDLIR